MRDRLAGFEQAQIPLLGPMEVGLAATEIARARRLARLRGQHRQAFQGLRVTRCMVDQLLERGPLLFGVTFAAGEPRTEIQHLGDRKPFGGQVRQGPARLVDRIDGARPTEPGSPDGGILGTPFPTGVQPSGRLGKRPGKQREVRARQPDAVVVRRLPRRLLDGGSHGLHRQHRAVDEPQGAKVARLVGRAVPGFLAKPADLIQPALPVEKLGIQRPQLGAARSEAGQRDGQEGLGIREPSLAVDQQACARLGGVRSPSRSQRHVCPRAQRRLGPSRGLFADPQQVRDLGMFRPPCRLHGQPEPRTFKLSRGDLGPRSVQTGLEPPLRADPQGSAAHREQTHAQEDQGAPAPTRR